ncbi:MAG TPA: prolyl oligopeptidase family serine peptidase, partial [Abditibacteriaceae bacterium]
MFDALFIVPEVSCPFEFPHGHVTRALFRPTATLLAMRLLPVFSLLLMTITASSAPLTYPKTLQVPQADVYHGVTVADPYRWLEEANAPATKEWIEAQNAVTFKYLHALPQRAPLIERLTQIWDYPKFSAPFKDGGRYFYFHNSGLQNQSVLMVQENLTAPARVLLDPNTLSQDGTVALSSLAVSRDGKQLAYGLSRGGSDWQEVHLRHVDDGRDSKEVLQWVKFSGLSWTKDNRGFFYSRYAAPPAGEALQAANHNHQLYYHRIGEGQSEDRLVYERPDQPDWRISAYLSEDGRYAWIYLSQTGPKNRLYYMDLGDSMQPNLAAPIIKLIDNFEADYSVIGNDGSTLYVKTDAEAPRGRVIAIDLAKPSPDNWTTLIPESNDTLQSVALMDDQFITTYLHNAHSAVRFFDLKGRLVKELALPGLGTVSGVGGQRYETEFFYSFTSFLEPSIIFRYDVKTGQSSVFRRSEIEFDATPYTTEQAWFNSKDGTRVPLFLTYRKGLKRDGNNPVYLYGYGGFNISLTPAFSIGAVTWLEAGGILAIPNLRGGGEFGEAWHLAGTKEKKQNVFDDFIAAAEFLIREKYTSPQKLAIAGGSNGGLLIGAVINQRPELFAAALPAVGVMDMLRFHKFTIGSAWVYDYGSSDDAAQFKALYA